MLESVSRILGINPNRKIEEWGTVAPTETIQVSAPVKEAPRYTVADIHRDFFTAKDNLQSEIDEIEEEIGKKKDEYEKLLKLEKFGFTGNVEQIREANIALTNYNGKLRILTAQKYFAQKYPQFKMITQDDVTKLCAKYNLICGDTELYKGTIPQKNINIIVNSVIDEKDLFSKSYMVQVGWNLTEDSHSKYQIVAPFNDFKLSNNKIVNPGTRQIESNYGTSKSLQADGSIKTISVPDPILLASVLHNHYHCYLIITAWGDEASDSLVVNERNN